MITIKNYYEKIKGIDPKTLPAELKKDYDFVYQITDQHKTWNYYKSDTDIKGVVDQYFASLSAHLDKENNKTVKKVYTQQDAREVAKSLIWSQVQQGLTVEQIKNPYFGKSGDDFSAVLQNNKITVNEIKRTKVNFTFPLQSIYNEIVAQAGQQEPIRRSQPAGKAKAPQKPATGQQDPELVERIEEESRFIKRYALMQGKVKTDSMILKFINELQKAILERRIRKTSKYAKEIRYIQDNLINLYDVLQTIKDPKRRESKIDIDKKVYEKFLAIGNATKVRLSINYLKRYVGIQGKVITKDKAERLLTLIENAVQQHKIAGNDPYNSKLKEIRSSLTSFVKVAKKNETLKVHEEVLNGINKTLEGCSCEVNGLNGIAEAMVIPLPQRPENTVMSSVDFSKLKFDTVGFTGKWKTLIGDPAEGFSAMVFGKPKMGKSYLCMDWAGYLARNHGNTLYVAREEKLDATLQKKLNDKDVKHPCLYVSDHLPGDLSPYKYIFLDSVNKLGLEPETLDGLKAQNPGKSFIGVHQTTKEGNFRGSNSYQHDVDVVIEVPERGKAVQFGRFNQGGEIDIFETGDQLMGIKKRYDVLSPDGFSIRIGVEPFTSLKERNMYFTKWKARYKQQGYYSSAAFGRIPLEDLSDYCQWIEVDEDGEAINGVPQDAGYRFAA